jgi:hypothetical protein
MTTDYFAFAVAADNAFQSELIRQFGDPDGWKRDYRYELSVRTLWDSQTKISHQVLMDANNLRHQQQTK